MKIELFNRSKYRVGSGPGDDVPVAVPGVVYGVFDGATDPLGTVVDGTAAGRLAALTVAAEMTAIALDPAARKAPGHHILGRLSSALKTRTDPLHLQIPPSTTLAVALDCGAIWRFLLLGDSGVRLNGSDVYHNEKTIDHVSTVARVALFNDFTTHTDNLDEVEAMTRRGIFLGLEVAVSEGQLTRSRASDIVDEAIFATRLESDADHVRAFLMGGIQTQYQFGNRLGNALCFDTLDGTTTQLNELRDFECPKDDIKSIEIFTDGYPLLPDEVSVAAWEAEYRTAEIEDFNRTGRLAAVKGATSTEFFDDRSVIVLT